MPRRHRVASLFLFALSLAVAGCSSNSAPTVPNPFMTADRVPPPAQRNLAPGTAQPYYPAAPTTAAPASPYPAANPYPPAGSSAPPFNAQPYNAAPAVTSPPASPYPAASPYPQSPGYPPTQQQPASPYPGATPPSGPYGAAPSASNQQIAASPGDAIASPGDAGSLRFASPSSVAMARTETTAASAVGQPQLASRPATANSWIAGTAPIRRSSETSTTSPRIRVPGEGWDQEPVSLAALGQPATQSSTQGGAVAIRPLEPAPLGSGAAPGEPAPLRVASPASTTGWR